VSGVSKEKLAHNQKIQESVSNIEKSLGARGRVLLRASGTEPLIRVMIEAENGNDAQQFAESLASLVKSELSL
jgi:phosphoglucosamine mutase